MKPFTLVLYLLVVFATTLALIYFWFMQPIGQHKFDSAIVELKTGEPLVAFSSRLKEKKLLSGSQIWTKFAQLRGLSTKAKAGEYWVHAKDTRESLLQRVVRGEVVSYEARIIEGWSVDELLAYLQGIEKLKKTLGEANRETLLERLKLRGGNAEGRFLPDTYHYVKGDSDADILLRAYEAMNEELKTVWSQRASELKSSSEYDLLIVASLIEKETGIDSERNIISQVFNSRLKRKMRLQTDPSVIYGLGNSFDGNLRRSDLKSDGPYNTYTRHGLPPTPIALPGIASLRAAGQPSDSKYFYFVGRGDGTTHFSETLEEHQKAVRRYQLGGMR